MPAVDSIDVRIFVDGAPLDEYIDHNDDKSDGRTLHRYVVAELDKEFVINIKLMPGFNFGSSQMVYAVCKVDNLSGHGFEFLKRNTTSAKRILLAEESRSFTGEIYQNESTGQWKKAPYVFGLLETSE